MSDPSTASVRMSLTSAKFPDLPLDRDGDEVFHALGRHSRELRGHDRRPDHDDRVFPLREIGIEGDRRRQAGRPSP